MEFEIWVFFENPPEKIQLSLKSEKDIEYFTW